ncbi:hypothetical protein AABB24_012072 [Solanum stoloniferum]|uniref:Uncharacterized protein n=1 Tax=Solanum stoloniferum TaxID=62892 RepID=A0ABD2U1E8_9SOLN
MNLEAQICKRNRGTREPTTPWLQNHRDLPSQDTGRIVFMPDPISPESEEIIIFIIASNYLDQQTQRNRVVTIVVEVEEKAQFSMFNNSFISRKTCMNPKIV